MIYSNLERESQVKLISCKSEFSSLIIASREFPNSDTDIIVESSRSVNIKQQQPTERAEIEKYGSFEIPFFKSSFK
jgi:hypothetical protein